MKLKARTPRKPKRRPWEGPCVFADASVTLLLLSMNKDNTITRVVEDLRAAAEAGAPGERLPSVRELMVPTARGR